jgi:hypothetical protein
MPMPPMPTKWIGPMSCGSFMEALRAVATRQPLWREAARGAKRAPLPPRSLAPHCDDAAWREFR